MPREEFHQHTVQQLARSFVTTILGGTDAEMTLEEIKREAQAIAAAQKLKDAKLEACQPPAIAAACLVLASRKMILRLSEDRFASKNYKPKYRTLDDYWDN